MKKIATLSLTFVVMAVTMITFFAVAPKAQAAEAGTLLSNAIILNDGESYTKYWTNSNYNLNCYNKITVPSRGYITFTVEKPCDDEGEYGTFIFNLHTPDGTLVWDADTGAQKDTFSDFYIYKIGLDAGTYYINISPNFSVFSDSAPIPSTYFYEFTPSDYWEVESNDTKQTATPITLGQMYSGVFTEQFINTLRHDYYSVNLTAGKYYRIYFDNYYLLESNSMTIFKLVSPSGSEISMYNPKEDGTASYWDIVAEETGKYYLKIYNDFDRAGTEYKIGVSDLTVNASALKASLSATSYSYDGKAKTPSVVVKHGTQTLKKDIDYTVSYPSGRIKPGTYSVTVKFKGMYAGSKTLTFKISAVDVSKLKVSLSSTSYKYDGNKKTPTIIAKHGSTALKKDVDYTVTYPSSRTAPGLYSVTIKFKGGYTGTKTLKFKITPATVNVAKMTATATTSSIKLTWGKVTGATGYKVYQYSSSQGKYVQIATVTGNTYNKTGLKAGTTYQFKVKAYKKLSNGTVIEGAASSAFATATKCAAPKISSLVASSGQKATLKWSAVTGATGYQVYYSTKKDSGYQKVVSTTSKTASKTFSKSAKGKKMYFKVRAYKKVNGKTVYSNWSAVKSVVIK